MTHCSELVETWKRTGLLEGLEESEWESFSKNCEALALDILSQPQLPKTITNLIFPIQRRVYPTEVRVMEEGIYANRNLVCTHNELQKMFDDMVPEGTSCLSISLELDVCKMLSEKINNKVLGTP